MNECIGVKRGDGVHGVSVNCKNRNNVIVCSADYEAHWGDQLVTWLVNGRSLVQGGGV